LIQSNFVPSGYVPVIASAGPNSDFDPVAVREGGTGTGTAGGGTNRSPTSPKSLNRPNYAVYARPSGVPSTIAASSPSCAEICTRPTDSSTVPENAPRLTPTIPGRPHG
jgi:hypothetical protein